VTALTITGRLASGLGEGAAFTGLPWAREQFIARLGLDPFPGTVNLVLESCRPTRAGVPRGAGR
jgi:CTP-dependent riboflavin kinase